MNHREALVEMQLRLKELLVEQARLGRRVVLAIDEAQNLDDSVLELVRMLSNFETSREKLMQIILCGQPQLADKIASPGLEQLRQRVAIFACLAPLSRADTQLYIDHRIGIAGYDFEAPLFNKEAVALIADCSDGIPRNINNLCFNSLTLGCALQRKPIDRDIVREVIADLDLERLAEEGLSCRAAGGERIAKDSGVSFRLRRAIHVCELGSEICACCRGPFRLGRGAPSEPSLAGVKGCRARAGCGHGACRSSSIFSQRGSIAKADSAKADGPWGNRSAGGECGPAAYRTGLILTRHGASAAVYGTSKHHKHSAKADVARDVC